MEEKSCLSSEFQAFLTANIKFYNQFKCKAAYLPNFGGCLVANQNVKEGEELLRIPESLFITLSVATKKNPILLEIKKHLNVQKKSILAFFLYQEKNDTSSSYFEYLNSIPKAYSNTITWSEEELNLLREELKVKHTKKQQKLLSEFEAIKSYLSTNEEQIVPFKDFNEGQFLQLVAMIESRTLFYKNEQDMTSEVGAMIPFYDLANHTFMEGVDHFKYFFFDSVTKEYVMRAYKDFENNEQIFITYGNYNNEHFLDYYGFIPFNNQREALQFTIQSDQLPMILGKEFTKKLRANTPIAQQLLNHFFVNSTLKPTLVFEVEESSHQFSWETITFLQVFSLDIDLKPIPPTSGSSSFSSVSSKSKAEQNSSKSKPKQNNKNESKPAKQQKNPSEKSQIAIVLEAFNSNEIENQKYYNSELFLQFSSNLKKYLQELYKNINFDRVEKFIKDFKESGRESEIPYTTLLAKEFTQREMAIIEQCKL